MQKKIVSINECKPGQILARDVYNVNGYLMVSENTRLNSFIIERLKEEHVITVMVYVPDEQEEESFKKYREVERKYSSTVQSVKKIINDLAVGKKLERGNVEQVSSSVLDSLPDKSSVLMCLSSVRSYDEYTFNHSVNVSFYSMLIASWIKLPQDKLKMAVEAGLLHDIGKAKIPPEVLNKKGKLTEKEFELMKKHPVLGYEMIKESKIEIPEDVMNSILMHHEREDGHGYPLGLKAKQIPVIAKIVALADVYDALTSQRIYKDRETPFDTFRELEIGGMGHFDTAILLTFLQNISSYYIGAEVIMNTGEKGRVVSVLPMNISYPIVEINGKYVDLSRDKNLKIVKLAN